MSNLSQQMQEKMTLRLHELRQKTMARMGEAGERIRKRPQLKDDKSLKTIQHHPLMVQNDDGAMIMSAAIGIPGLDATTDAAIDVAEQLYSDRKAAHARPQDDEDYSPTQARDIRIANQQDLALFQDLDDKLNTLNTYIAQGYTLGLNWNGELVPYEDMKSPAFTMKLDPVEEMKARAEGLDYLPRPQQKAAAHKMTLGA